MPMPTSLMSMPISHFPLPVSLSPAHYLCPLYLCPVSFPYVCHLCPPISCHIIFFLSPILSVDLLTLPLFLLPIFFLFLDVCLDLCPTLLMTPYPMPCPHLHPWHRYSFSSPPVSPYPPSTPLSLCPLYLYAHVPYFTCP